MCGCRTGLTCARWRIRRRMGTVMDMMCVGGHEGRSRMKLLQFHVFQGEVFYFISCSECRFYRQGLKSWNAGTWLLKAIFLSSSSFSIINVIIFDAMTPWCTLCLCVWSTLLKITSSSWVHHIFLLWESQALNPASEKMRGVLLPLIQHIEEEV